ncbi:neurohypophysial n-terminal domain protein [Ichthyophthirius multifiliis]|uniref:Neurohypophysial n-terminal domain protein n=1 Tax=Ichthyophthirius multifiliis TaxID=5932 RepID=G0QZP0_ICHMU|nr:neurohypophysial n-terminal domain protein [Ichthyophthirius multifiliis]EGR29314.1 neurohypophysial n-terminal domain protein [Ichthyophthirius multifiliis]|eukprot:XP_004030550.1 neurohypophysial n-terminal domain protein [Ichthyophthirius multifiliis]
MYKKEGRCYDLCPLNTFLDLSKKQCEQQCPLYFFADNNTKECLKCQKNCLLCVSKNSCIRCEFGFFYDQEKGECFSLSLQIDYCINDSKYLNLQNFQCIPCSKNCRKCNIFRCLECQGELGEFLIDNNTGTCVQCASLVANCAKCRTDFLCLICQESFIIDLNTGNCQEGCIQGKYMDKKRGKCEYCPLECIQCELLETNLICILCIEGYFSNENNKCKKCSDNCEKCSSQEKCERCLDLYFLLEERCIKECPKGFFGNNESRECLKCNPNCAECANINECQTCIQGFFLDINDKFCSLCNPECQECVLQASNCTICAFFMYLFQVDQNTVKCVDSCLPTQFADEKRRCIECPFSCNQCISSNKCTSCKQGFYFQNDNGQFIGICLKCNSRCRRCENQNTKECIACNDGEYSSGSSCQKCDSQCKNCIGKNPDQCTACTQGFYVRLIYQNAGFCEKCYDLCYMCISGGENACTKCIFGYFLFEGFCFKKCINGLIENTQTRQCECQQVLIQIYKQIYIYIYIYIQKQIYMHIYNIFYFTYIFIQQIFYYIYRIVQNVFFQIKINKFYVYNAKIRIFIKIIIIVLNNVLQIKLQILKIVYVCYNVKIISFFIPN